MVSSSKVHNLFVWTEMWENKTKDKLQFLVSFIMLFYRFKGKIWMKMKCFNDSKLLNVEKFHLHLPLILHLEIVTTIP